VDESGGCGEAGRDFNDTKSIAKVARKESLVDIQVTRSTGVYSTSRDTIKVYCYARHSVSCRVRRLVLNGYS